MTDGGIQPVPEGAAPSGPARLRPARLLGILAGLALAIMALIVFVDVVGRYFFNLPVTGSYELMFIALPAVTARRQHVTVDLIDTVLPRRADRFLQGVVNLVCAVALGGMAWHLWILGAKAAEYGDVTSFLRIPLHPVAYGMAGLSGLAAIAALLSVVKAPNGPTGDNASR